MTSPPPFILDAGPALNFLSKGHQNLLINAVGRQTIHAPAAVETEVFRKSRKVGKFKGAAGRWNSMKPNWINILPDDGDDQRLVHAAESLTNTPLNIRLEQGDDLGETMVVLHAYIRAEQGAPVYVIIDDAGGRAFAKTAIDDLQERKTAGDPVGSITIVRTIHIIGRRLNTPDIPDKATLKAIWADISPLDDGLENDIKKTGLLAAPAWNRPPGK